LDECFFKVDVEGRPSTVSDIRETHGLKLRDEGKKRYVCQHCFEIGRGFSYSCEVCENSYHIGCEITLPKYIRYEEHNESPLELMLNPKTGFRKGFYTCLKCKRKGKYWAYYCGSCKEAYHVRCIKQEMERHLVKAVEMSAGGSFGGKRKRRKRNRKSRRTLSKKIEGKEQQKTDKNQQTEKLKEKEKKEEEEKGDNSKEECESDEEEEVSSVSSSASSTLSSSSTDSSNNSS